MSADEEEEARCAAAFSGPIVTSSRGNEQSFVEVEVRIPANTEKIGAAINTKTLSSHGYFQVVRVDSSSTSTLLVNDRIMSVNGIELNAVGIFAMQAFKALKTRERVLRILRPVAPGDVADVADPLRSWGEMRPL